MGLVEVPQLPDGSPSEDELRWLVSIVRGLRVKSIFEIGTGTGETISFLAGQPTVEQAWTLDLPAAMAQATRWPLLETDHRWIGLQKVELPGNVEQLWGDSARFDFAPYYGRCDLVFVMGSHSAKYIFSDLRAARKMASKRGAIIWHGGTPSPVELVMAEYRLLLLSDRMGIVWR